MQFNIRFLLFVILKNSTIGYKVTQLLPLFFIGLFFALGTVSAQPAVSNIQVEFSCPGEVTVTYDLHTDCPSDATLYYSPDKRNWLKTKSVTGDLTAQSTGTGKKIVWDNLADSVRYGGFYFKVEAVDSCKCPCVEINGVCWATRNVDAPGTFTAKPEDVGMLYQWNSRIGWSSINPLVSTPVGATWITDRDSLLAPSWESANNPCPPCWRVPTVAELQSLIDAGSVWTTVNGKNGRLFGSGNNTIFLPAAAYRDPGLSTSNFSGYYWSSTIYNVFQRWASALSFFSATSNLSIWNIGILTNGYPVRCVKE